MGSTIASSSFLLTSPFFRYSLPKEANNLWEGMKDASPELAYRKQLDAQLLQPGLIE